MFDTSTEEGEKNLISGLDGLNMREEGTFSMTYSIKINWLVRKS